MPSTFTGSGLEKPGSGEQTNTWDDTLNLNFDIIDRLASQAGTISLTGTTHTLTISDGVLSEGQYAVMVFAGSPSGTNTVTISPNTAKRMFFARNTSGQTVILTQGSGGNVTVLNGEAAIVYCDGAGSGAAVVNIAAELPVTGLGTMATQNAVSVDINGGAIDGAVIGGATPAAGSFTTLGASGTATFGTVDINGGTIDGVAGSFTTLSASEGGTLGGNFTLSGIWDFTAGSGYFVIPSGTEAQKPAEPVPGMIYHNTDNSGQLEYYRDGVGGWREIIDEFSGGQALKNKRLLGPITTETNDVSWGATATIDPEDGLILMVTLTASSTLTDALADEESVLLLIDDGTDYTITWPTMTWLSDDGVAPTLRTTGLTSVLLWKDDTTLYGFCGNGA